MPKVIENLQETLISKAKSILLTKGYDALTIRGVAKECGIAIGTVYNYFTSKEEMTGYVMLEDWQNMLSSVSEKIKKTNSAEKALTALYEGILKFNKTYHFIWKGYVMKESDTVAYKKRHQLLIEQISACVQQVFDLYPPVNTVEQAAVFLAENILIASENSSLHFSSVLNIAMTVFYKK